MLTWVTPWSTRWLWWHSWGGPQYNRWWRLLQRVVSILSLLLSKWRWLASGQVSVLDKLGGTEQCPLWGSSPHFDCGVSAPYISEQPTPVTRVSNLEQPNWQPGATVSVSVCMSNFVLYVQQHSLGLWSMGRKVNKMRLRSHTVYRFPYASSSGARRVKM